MFMLKGKSWGGIGGGASHVTKLARQALRYQHRVLLAAMPLLGRFIQASRQARAQKMQI